MVFHAWRRCSFSRQLTRAPGLCAAVGGTDAELNFSSALCVPSQEQASWVCQCDDNMVQRLETDFKMTLQQQSTLEQWAAWLDNVMMQALKPYEGRPSFPKAARQFLLKWSFYRYRAHFFPSFILHRLQIRVYVHASQTRDKKRMKAWGAESPLGPQPTPPIPAS